MTHFISFLGGMFVLMLVACADPGPARPVRTWTESELRNMTGKSKDDVREMLGSPTGLATIDQKQRWHYAHITVEGADGGNARTVSVLIYFSQFGEHRVTLVDIRSDEGR